MGSPPGSAILGILQARTHWSGLPLSSPPDSITRRQTSPRHLGLVTVRRQISDLFKALWQGFSCSWLKFWLNSVCCDIRREPWAGHQLTLVWVQALPDNCVEVTSASRAQLPCLRKVRIQWGSFLSFSKSSSVEILPVSHGCHVVFSDVLIVISKGRLDVVWALS